MGSLTINENKHPTLDLHCHLRGTITPGHATELAQKHAITLPKSVAGDGYAFSGFDNFLTLYDQVGHVVRSAQDLHEIAYRYLRKVAKQGTCYVEFMISPGHSIANGIDFGSQISALSDALDIAQAEFGVFGCIIVTCVRHRGSEEAVNVAELASRVNNRYLRGFGLTGNEHKFDVEDFVGAFAVAQSSGLELTAHVGEWSPAAEVTNAVNKLNLKRVGHGISVAAEPSIMAELAERKTGFEICLSSNVQLGASRCYETHPVRQLLNAGCKVALSTDDPAYFDTTPFRELSLATQCLDLTSNQIDGITADSIEMAFCDESTKQALRQKINSLYQRTSPKS
ncbi:adenosine deaminase [uncultured Tateyamaria sp.]|uniref:adenosine deaminase n=1 Tax=uncultured Tateyamaria sp. TaxID=455651 RepID=UPI00261AF9C6|nr:adenosine deaminase [uncultured Tateyamaria sp.]